MSDPYAGTGVDPSTMHPARRYDYLLGGKDNFAVDRESAEALIAADPRVKTGVVENRRCRNRMVTELATVHKIRQFLDIGTGIPTRPNTHEVAQGIDSTARIVYVDNDPLVMTHARALLTGTAQGETAYVEADLLEPQQILSAAELRDTLDLSQPVALMYIAVWHFLPDTDAICASVNPLLDALAPGSMLAFTHATLKWAPWRRRRALSKELKKDLHGTTRMRDKAELKDLLRRLGVELVAPGLVSTVDWRPELAPHPGEGVSAADAMCWAALARRP